MLVEVNAAPDRAAHRRVVDEEWQRLVGDRVADADPPPVRLSTKPLRQPEAKERGTAHDHTLPSVDPADRSIIEGGGEVAQPVTVSRKPVLGQEDDDVAP